MDCTLRVDIDLNLCLLPPATDIGLRTHILQDRFTCRPDGAFHPDSDLSKPVLRPRQH